MLRASGKTASATLVHQNQLFIIIKVIILLDYVYIVHLMYSCLHICISIDFGNKYLSIYLSTLQDSNIAIMCNDVSAIAYLRNQGGTRSQQMCRMAIDTCEWDKKRSMTLIPRHLPGHLNVLADHLSRRDQFLKTEWSLNPAAARRVFRV